MANGFTLTFTGDQEVPPNGTAASGVRWAKRVGNY